METGRKMQKFAKVLTVFGVAIAVQGCSAIMGTIKVEADVTCSWARLAPVWSDSVVNDISDANLPDEAFDALAASDDFMQKHNELFVTNCQQ